jgi:hypothetical protein
MNSSTSTRHTKTTHKSRATSKAALGRYLAAGLGATGLATVESEAAIVNRDITNIGGQNLSGINGGVPANSFKIVSNFLGLTGRDFLVGNSYGSYDEFGFIGFSLNGVRFASAGTLVTPVNFPENSTVGPSATWAPLGGALFATSYTGGGFAPSFPLTPSSHIGFRVAANGTGPTFGDATEFNYGYFRVTWEGTNDANAQFQILSGAYESTVNTPIPVPEPAGVALAGIGALALGAGAIRRSRKARKAAAEGTLAEAV